MNLTFSPSVNDLLNITVECNELMETLNLVVLGAFGLIHSEKFINSKFQQNFNFNLNVTENMAPVASVIVFYVKEDGRIVSDQFNLKLERNFVSKLIFVFEI